MLVDRAAHRIATLGFSFPLWDNCVAQNSTRKGVALMSLTRSVAVSTTLSCAVLLGGAGRAVAAPVAAAAAQPLAKVVPVHGRAENGKRFRGTFTIQRFVPRNGRVVAVGTVRGRLKGRDIVRRDVRMPASLRKPAGASASQIPPTPGACTVLELSIGPINLTLLGLTVRTTLPALRIDAVPGQGNLLGNLVCQITGLLDPGSPANATPSERSGMLNALLALAPRTA